MGTWGPAPFENDDAADFVADFEHEGIAAIERALSIPHDRDVYLEAPDASAAIAAAAFVAAAAGFTDSLSPSARDAFQKSGEKADILQLAGRAESALERILASNSELLELWEEAAPDDLEACRTPASQSSLSL